MSESFLWVLRAIESFTNAFHYMGCKTLIELFYKRYGPPNGGNDEFDENLSVLIHALAAKEKAQQ